MNATTWNNTSARELSWAAGLFEGEGSIHLTPDFKPRIALAMTDEDSVIRFANAVGVGNISGPRMPKGGTKLLWTWNAAQFEHVQHCVAVLWFGLGHRRRTRAVEVLQGVRYKDPSTCKNNLHSRTLTNTIIRRDGRTECNECLKKSRRDSYRRLHSVPEAEYRV